VRPSPAVSDGHGGASICNALPPRNRWFADSLCWRELDSNPRSHVYGELRAPRRARHTRRHREFHINAATLVRTCLTKAIEECGPPRDAACGHACLTCPGRAHRDKLGLVRDVALLRNEKQTARLAE
jgi:hypothetical protein